jgi:carotenoid 1,2-hydratase
VAVPDGGYRWWYVDGMSADGSYGIVVIAFIGSVFSPYYFKARQRGPADPHNHVAINVGLYRPRGDLWAMTERSHRSLERNTDFFRVGPSSLTWRNDRLEIDIHERSAPLGLRLTGRVVVEPAFINTRGFPLDAGGRHRWRPIAPDARIDVQLERPGLSWQGDGYIDTNAGERALEDDFVRWNWSRAPRRSETLITYAVTQVDGQNRALAIAFDQSGAISDREVPSESQLPGTLWKVDRPARSHEASVLLRTLEDTPFYTRSVLCARADEEEFLMMHESLDLERFRSRWVRTLLPFRMPRVR